MNTFPSTTRPRPMLALAGLIVAGLACLPIGAQAETPTDGYRTIVVRFADLNADSPAGAAALYQRIHRAALEACGFVDSWNSTQVLEARACADASTAQAVASINNPALTREFLVRTGKAVAPAAVADSH